MGYLKALLLYKTEFILKLSRQRVLNGAVVKCRISSRISVFDRISETAQRTKINATNNRKLPTISAVNKLSGSGLESFFGPRFQAPARTRCTTVQFESLTSDRKLCTNFAFILQRNPLRTAVMLFMYVQLIGDLFVSLKSSLARSAFRRLSSSVSTCLERCCFRSPGRSSAMCRSFRRRTRRRLARLTRLRRREHSFRIRGFRCLRDGCRPSRNSQTCNEKLPLIMSSAENPPDVRRVEIALRQLSSHNVELCMYVCIYPFGNQM